MPPLLTNLLTFTVLPIPFASGLWVLYLCYSLVRAGVNKLETLGVLLLIFIAAQSINVGRHLIKKTFNG